MYNFHCNSKLRMMKPIFAIVALIFLANVASVAQGQTVEVKNKVLDGEAPGITVSGLANNSEAIFHVLRRFSKYESDQSGNWQRVEQILHSWAAFKANGTGEIKLDTFQPFAGTYTSPDAIALLRTGYLLGDKSLKGVRQFDSAELADLKEGAVAIRVEQDEKIVSKAEFRLVSDFGDLTTQTVSEEGLHGVFTCPNEGRELPVVISLHGSEGGSIEKARTRAASFASRGFATLAINYFAYPYESIEGVPTSHIETPIEMIERAKKWLENQERLDLTKINLYGVSKGAEFSLVAATKYDWINSVVAVVPSDVVWAGYGDEKFKVEQKSSWSFGGKPLPFITLFQFDPTKEGLYRTNTERYLRSRLHYSSDVPASLIPIEKATARILLLASDRDEVWASGEMSRNLVERMMIAGKEKQIEVKIYPLAGHQIAGTGTFPIRLYGTDSSDPAAKDLVAEGNATAESWKRTIKFFNSK